MQQSLLEESLLAAEGTDKPDAEAIPLTTKNPESKDHGQNSQDEIVSENNLNVTDTELTAVTESPASDSNIQYQLLSDSDPSTVLSHFLNSVGIDRRDIQQAGISESHLLKLFQKETSCLSFLQWCSIDHIVEKTLQWPLLSPKDVSESALESWFKRVRPHSRSILLKSMWGLMKGYGARGFAKGVETSLAKSVHYFIYAMLMYRLVGWLQIGQDNFVELKDLFQNSNQKGIDSLVVALAKLSADWLRLILVSPLIIGAFQSMVSLIKAREISSAKLQKIIQDIADELRKPNRFCRNTVREMLPLLNQIISLSSKIQNLEQLVRWDGRLSVNDRRQSFEYVRRAAKESHQMAQLNILESLAKIVHGVGLKELPRLHSAGYSKAELLEILYAKTTALSDLEELSRIPNRSWKSKFTSTSRRVYSIYLLWWLGLSTSFLKQRLPFFLFKAGKLTLEIFFLQQIMNSILEAIRCPDKPGFKFGDGYQDWSSDYTAECFTTRIELFRVLNNANESVDALVAEISQYHLIELTSLELSNKYLTTDEASQIIQAVLRQKAPLKTLNLGSNQLTAIPKGMFAGLSQLNTLDLNYNHLSTLSDAVFSGLGQLNTLNLYRNQLSTLSDGVFSGLGQLNTLWLISNQLSILSDGVFSGLSQLRDLYLGSNQLSTLSDGVFSGLSQLNTLDLSSNRLSTLSTGVFSGLSQLKFLYLNGNRLSTLGDDVFSGLSQLNTLYLGSNQLSTLGDGVFSGLSQLNHLSLDVNQLSTLSDGIFSGLSQLKSLYLSLNNFNTTAVMNILNQLPSSLTALDITSNPIDSIPQNFSALFPVSLLSLSIGGDYVPKTLTREFMQHFPFQLTQVSIRSSSIANITAGTFLDFSALISLDLSWNQLSTLSNGVFSGLSQLKSLYFGSNQLSTLGDGVFSGLSQLNTLVLYSNQFSTLRDGVFSGLSQLKSLYLNGNQLSILSDGIFSGLSQLNDLSLDVNQLSTLSDGIFSGLSQLNTLYLDGNQFSTLSDGVFSGLSQLNYLSLVGNQLSTLSDNLFEGLNQLIYLNLGVNYLNDTAIKNLTRHFPYQLNYLSLDANNIGNEGALALAKLLPCTNLTYIDFAGNPANDTAIILAAQQKALQKVCDDKRCHANLPASQSCDIQSEPDSTSVSKLTWGTQSAYAFFTNHSLDHFNSLALPHADSSPISEHSLFTPTQIGTALIGVVGFSLLLYKNASMVRNFVNAACRFLQRCFYGTSPKISTNHCSFHSPNTTRKLLCTDTRPTVSLNL